MFVWICTYKFRQVYTWYTAIFLVQLVAVTGFLLLIGVNIVVRQALDKHFARYPFSVSSAKLREVFYAKNVVVSYLPEEKNKAVSVRDIFAQGIVCVDWSLGMEAVFGDWLAERSGRSWEDYGRSVYSVMRVAHAKVTYRNILAFFENRCECINLSYPRWSLSAVDHCGNCKNFSIFSWPTIREGDTNPASLVNAHSFSGVVSLRDVSSQSEEGNSYGSREPQPVWGFNYRRIVVCLLHVVFSFIVGVFLTKHFLSAFWSGRVAPALFFLAMMIVSAAHGVSYIFKLVDACTNRVFL